jgi:hypothetical protein
MFRVTQTGNLSEATNSNLVVAGLSGRQWINGAEVIHSITRSDAADVVNRVKTATALYNVASTWCATEQWVLAKPVLDHLCSSSAISEASGGLMVLTHLLRLELLIKVIQNGRYHNRTCPTMTRSEIMGTVKASEQAVRSILKLQFHGNHIASVPAGADVLRLSPPVCTSSSPIQETWSYSQPNTAGTEPLLAVTQYGYELFAGLVMLLRLHLCLARLHIALSAMNDAKIHLRSALDVYSRYLRHVEQGLQNHPSSGDSSVVQIVNNANLFPLMALVGTLNVPINDPGSVASQVSRHHRLVMDVLVSSLQRVTINTEQF